jgi:diguanylate cyclase (GGDEF)-like protein
VRNEQLDQLSRSDGLTGLHNRRHLDQELVKEGNKARRHQQPLAVLMLDIDHFKHVNDQEGHPAGDRVLQEFATRLEATVRSGTIVGRWGGEEFLVIAPQTNAEDAATLGERIRKAIANHPVDLGDHSIPITVSVGGAVGVRPPVELVAQADAALYRSKDEGRNRVTIVTVD